MNKKVYFKTISEVVIKTILTLLKSFLYWTFRNFKPIFVTVLSIQIISITMMYSYYRGAIRVQKETTDEIRELKDTNKLYQYSLLKISDENKDLNEKYKNVVSSKEFLIYKIFRLTGVRVPNKVPKEHIQAMYDSAIKNRVPLRIFFRTIYVESEFKSTATSRVGAKGYLQLMPDTYTKYTRKLRLRKTPVANIKCGAYYLGEMYSYWRRRVKSEHLRWALTLASYNAGIDNVIRVNGIPDNGVTPQYVKAIMN